MKKPRHLIIVPALLVLVILAAVTAPLLAQSGNSWYVVYYSDPNWSVPSAGHGAQQRLVSQVHPIEVSDA